MVKKYWIQCRLQYFLLKPNLNKLLITIECETHMQISVFFEIDSNIDSVNIVIKLNGSVQDIIDSVSRYNYQASNTYI